MFSTPDAAAISRALISAGLKRFSILSTILVEMFSTLSTTHSEKSFILSVIDAVPLEIFSKNSTDFSEEEFPLFMMSRIYSSDFLSKLSFKIIHG